MLDYTPLGWALTSNALLPRKMAQLTIKSFGPGLATQTPNCRPMWHKSRCTLSPV